MSDFVVALGLVLVIEGLLWAAFPGTGRAMLEAVSSAPDQRLRVSGAVAMAIGVFIVWLVRG